MVLFSNYYRIIFEYIYIYIFEYLYLYLKVIFQFTLYILFFREGQRKVREEREDRDLKLRTGYFGIHTVTDF